MDIQTRELTKLTRAVTTLIPVRSICRSRALIFQCKDALDAGIISRYEARRVLEFNGQPNHFPCFAEHGPTLPASRVTNDALPVYEH